MYNLKYTKEFEKALKKLSKAEQRATMQKLKLLVQDPFYPSLRTKRCRVSLMSLKYGYRNPTGFRRWVKVAKSGGLCYTCVMGTWKSKTDTSICYSTILFSYASIERNC